MNGEYDLADSSAIYIYLKCLTARGKGIYVEIVVNDVCVDAFKVGVIVKCL